MTIPPKILRTIASVSTALFVATTAVAQSATNEWLDSPEAAFMTNAERQEWWTLHTDEQREAFKDRYWTRRDPTPTTPRNEFREMLAQRIATADKKYTIDRRVPGSETWRGQVYLIFGTPARVSSFKNGQGQPLGAAEISNPNSIAVNGNEETEVWIYERARTPKILDVIGMPELAFKFVVEPAKQSDDLQNPGTFHQLRDRIAEKTIINDVAAPVPSQATAITTTKPLTADVVSALDHAGENGGAVRSSILWSGENANATFWLVAPNVARADGQLSLYGRVKDSSGKTVATIARGVAGADIYSTHQGGGIVADATVQLPPGEYDAEFVLNNQKNAGLAAGTTHIIVPEVQSQFAVSSLVLTDRVDTASGIPLGRIHIHPRADATFTTSESMWYFFQVANPSDPAKVTVAVRLRHGVAPPTSPTVVPASLESIGPSRYMSGFEMPLKDLAPGDYTLYVSVHDAAGREDVLRRADFKVVEAPRLQ
jgi:GWxTD domain-containing protein